MLFRSGLGKAEELFGEEISEEDKETESTLSLIHILMLPFLKAPADAPLMTDKYEIDARYRYWRRHILLTIWLGYALFYFTRKSFNAAVPEILANGVLSRRDIGLLATLFYITYGVSKFVSGIVSDRSNARYFKMCIRDRYCTRISGGGGWA